MNGLGIPSRQMLHQRNNITISSTLKRNNNDNDNGKCQSRINTYLHGREMHFHARLQAHPRSRLPHVPPPTRRRSRQALPFRRRFSIRQFILRTQHVRSNAPTNHLFLQHPHPCTFSLHHPFLLLPLLQPHEAEQRLPG